VDRTWLCRLQGQVDAGRVDDQHDSQQRLDGRRAADKRIANAKYADARQKHLNALAFQKRQAFFRAGGQRHVDRIVGEAVSNQTTDGRLIVNDKDVGGFHEIVSVIATRTIVPEKRRRE
jgi:hypothetical protein